MAEVELAEDTLIVHVRGMDKLWTLKSRLEIPLSHVIDAQAHQTAGGAMVVARHQDRWNAHAGGHHSGHLLPGG